MKLLQVIVIHTIENIHTHTHKQKQIQKQKKKTKKLNKNKQTNKTKQKQTNKKCCKYISFRSKNLNIKFYRGIL